MDDTTQVHSRWFHLTPGRVVLLLLAVECLLWLSDRFGLPSWHKGYAVLTGVAMVGVAMVMMLLWFGVALVFRRRFQFSLRTLLVLVVVVALPFSWSAAEMKGAREQREAAKRIEKAGGEAWYDYHVTFDDQQHVHQICPQANAPGWVLLRRSLGDDFFNDVVVVEVQDDRFTDSDLEHVQKLTRLTYLLLDTEKVTDAGLQGLEGLAQLQELVIVGPPVTDVGLQHLEGLSRITRLVLNPTEVTDVTDSGLKHLACLKRLQDLDLGYAEVTDTGLENLSGLSHLQRLNLKNTQVTTAGIAKLQQALPNCKITR